MATATRPKQARTLTLEYWQDEGWYVGRLREVPGVFSQGETLEELEENIRDAYLLLSDYRAMAADEEREREALEWIEAAPDEALAH